MSPSRPTSAYVVTKHDSKAALLPRESISGFKLFLTDLVLRFSIRFLALFDADVDTGVERIVAPYCSRFVTAYTLISLTE